MGTGKAPNPGVNCLGSSNAWGFPPRRSWPLATVRLDSGSPCRKNMARVAQQRCWVHKTANILDKMPKSVQGKAKQLTHEMYLAPTRKAALAAYERVHLQLPNQISKGLRMSGER